MNKGKTGILKKKIGNLLYLSYIYFTGNETTSAEEFSSGLLLGLSIGINLVGIILVILHLSKDDKNKNL